MDGKYFLKIFWSDISFKTIICLLGERERDRMGDMKL